MCSQRPLLHAAHRHAPDARPLCCKLRTLPDAPRALPDAPRALPDAPRAPSDAPRAPSDAAAR